MSKNLILFSTLLFGLFPVALRADSKLVLESSEHHLYFLFPDKKKSNQVLVIHDIPGLVTIRLVLEFEDDKALRHTLSLRLCGYQKIFPINCAPGTAHNWRILNLETEYKEEEVACSLAYSNKDGKCRFSANSRNDSTTYIFHQLPELSGKVTQRP